MSDPTPPRARFSLRTLLVLVAVVCFAIGSYVVARKMSDANRELRKLRNEAGVLSVDDPTKVHVIAVDVGEANTWRWRTFIPKGHKYSWNIAAEQIPRSNPPQKAGISGFSNEPYWERDNELLVTARLRQEDDGNWRLSVDPVIGDSKNQMAGASLKIPKEKMEWMTDGRASSTDGRVLGNKGVQVIDPKGPIILLQRRPTERQPDGSHQPSPNPMPGYMIWLNEE
jgi:hypothetical protein